MVALRPAEFDRFLARLGREAALVMVFGPDEGRVRNRVAAIAAATLGSNPDPMARVELEVEAVNADPPRLMDEANAISMFGADRRLLLIQRGDKLAKPILQALLDAPPLATIVLIADDLPKKSPFRTAMEAHPAVTVIACYPPDSSEMLTQIDQRVRATGRTITPAARAALAEIVAGDFGLAESEIDKLLTYTEGSLAIDVDDVEAIVCDTAVGSGSEALDRAFTGDVDGVEPAVQRAIRDGLPAAGLLQLAILHVMMIRRYRAARSAGRLEEIMRAERVHFRRYGPIQKQVDSWSDGRLARAAETLALAQKNGRLNSALEEAIAVRALWSIALASRRG